MVQIDGKKTAQILKSHPRFLKYWKQLSYKDDPGWVHAKETLNYYYVQRNRQAESRNESYTANFIIKEGAIHVDCDKPKPKPQCVVLPVYGLREDFQGIGANCKSGQPSACYTKIYIPKTAWRRIIDHERKENQCNNS